MDLSFRNAVTMQYQLRTPKNLTDIRGRILTYVMQAPHFKSLREVFGRGWGCNGQRLLRDLHTVPGVRAALRGGRFRNLVATALEPQSQVCRHCGASIAT